MENWATKENFFKCPVPKEKYSIDGIGDIWIHGLTSGEKDEYENDVIQISGGSRRIRMANARAVLIQRCVYNQHGARLFAEKDIGLIPCKWGKGDDHAVHDRGNLGS